MLPFLIGTASSKFFTNEIRSFPKKVNKTQPWKHSSCLVGQKACAGVVRAWHPVRCWTSIFKLHGPRVWKGLYKACLLCCGPPGRRKCSLLPPPNSSVWLLSPLLNTEEAPALEAGRLPKLALTHYFTRHRGDCHCLCANSSVSGLPSVIKNRHLMNQTYKRHETVTHFYLQLVLKRC